MGEGNPAKDLMNGYERIKAALEGRQSDKVPIMLHNFMPAAHEAGYSMRAFRSDPQAIADSFIQAVETYEYDGILMDVDTATLAEVVGVPVDLPENEPARCVQGCIQSLRDVSDLEPADITNRGRVPIWLEAVRRLREYFGDEILIRGNADQAPFSLASMMRSPAEWMMDLLDEDNRSYVSQLLEYCTQVTGQFIQLMSEAGAHITSNGDSPAGPEMISPEMYRQFALPYEKRMVEIAHRSNLPYVLHICGSTEIILNDMVSSGADGIELDQKTDTEKARKLISDRCAFFGSIDPSGVMALGTPKQVEKQTRSLLDTFSCTTRFVLNAGCALPATTPAENIKAMIRTARNYR